MNKCVADAYHLIVAQPLRGLDGPVQTGFADVHVLGVGVLGQLLHKSPNIHVVVIIDMTEPPKKQEQRNI